MSKGRTVGHKEAYIDIGDRVCFTNNDLEDSGTWKGRVTQEFFNFILSCSKKYKENKYSTKNIFWIK